jgi:putative AlgH/UPF0301 family transcriptional regulator
MLPSTRRARRQRRNYEMCTIQDEEAEGTDTSSVDLETGGESYLTAEEDNQADSQEQEPQQQEQEQEQEQESEQEEIMCRICFGEDEVDNLISPCECTGGQQYVHLACLRQWQMSAVYSTNSERAETCNVCNAAFTYGLPTEQVTFRLRKNLIPFLVNFFRPLSFFFILFLLYLKQAKLVPGLQAGSILIATDEVESPAFRKSVILLLEHSSWGAKGVIINRPATETVVANYVAAPPLSNSSLDISSPTLPKEELTIIDGSGGPIMKNQPTFIHPAAWAYFDSKDLVVDNKEGYLKYGSVADGWTNHFDRLNREYFGVRLGESEAYAGGLEQMVIKTAMQYFYAHGTEPDREHPPQVVGIRTMGYAGWVPGQLEGEYWRGSWRIYNSSIGARDIFHNPAGLRKLWSKMMHEMVVKGVDVGGEKVERTNGPREVVNPFKTLVKFFELLTGVQGHEIPDREGAMVSLAPILLHRVSYIE